jgi:hypothetical protein
MVGDLILDVNGQDIRKMAYSDVAFLLKTLPQGKVSLRVGRFKSSTAGSPGTGSGSGVSSAPGSKPSSRRTSLVSQQTTTAAAATTTTTTTVTICEQATVIGADAAVCSKLTTFKPCLKK